MDYYQFKVRNGKTHVARVVRGTAVRTSGAICGRNYPLWDNTNGRYLMSYMSIRDREIFRDHEYIKSHCKVCRRVLQNMQKRGIPLD